MLNESQNIIVLLSEEGGVECWGSITEVCRNHRDFSYHYLKGRKFPFKYKGVWFYKVKYREVNF